MFYYKYVELCNKRNMSPSAAAEEMGFHRSDVTRWSKGSQPRQATIQKIADYFKVSVSELISEEQKEKPPAQGGELSEKDMRLIAWLRSLPPETLEAILTLGGGPKDLAD